MSEQEAPEGFHYEWVPELENWKLIGPYDGKRKCAGHRGGCAKEAVVLLHRRHAKFPSGGAWWGYCADHMYGRKIENGIVKERRAVPNEVTK